MGSDLGRRRVWSLGSDGCLIRMGRGAWLVQHPLHRHKPRPASRCPGLPAHPPVLAGCPRHTTSRRAPQKATRVARLVRAVPDASALLLGFSYLIVPCGRSYSPIASSCFISSRYPGPRCPVERTRLTRRNDVIPKANRTGARTARGSCLRKNEDRPP